MNKFPLHGPKQIEFIQQRNKKDCGVACAAMLAGKLYFDMAAIFDGLGKSIKRAMYPDDLFEALEELGFDYQEINSLPDKGRALVAIRWKDESLEGHYVVWDSKRKQFLDPLHGVMGKKQLLKYATIDYVWKIIRRRK